MTGKQIWILLSILITGIIFNSCSKVNPIETQTPKPSISVTTDSLSFGNITVNAYSNVKTFAISGYNLKSNITITPPSGCEISLAIGNNFVSTTLTINQSGGIVPATTLYTRIKPTAVQSYTGDIICSTTDYAEQKIALTGTGIAATIPTITIDQNSLNFANQIINTTSNPQSLIITGTNVSGEIKVKIPTGFDLATSKSELGKSKADSISLPSSGGTVFVKFKPTFAQNYTGSIIVKATGVNTQNIPVSGVGVILGQPLIEIESPLLEFGKVLANSTSPEQNFKVSGSNLTGDITIKSPIGYQISKTTGTGFDSVIVLSPSKMITTNNKNRGSVSATNIFVRFNPTTDAIYNKNIVCKSAGAVEKIVYVRGEGTAIPVPNITVNPNSHAFGNLTVGKTLVWQFVVEGKNLDTNIVITSPEGYYIAANKGAKVRQNSRNSISIPHNNGTIGSTIINVVFSPISEKQYNGNITCTSTGAVTQNIALTGNGTRPKIYSSSPSVNFNQVQINTISAEQVVKVYGSNLDGNITINSPANFEISKTAGTGFGNQIILNIPAGMRIGTKGNIPETDIFVRFRPTTLGACNDSLKLISVGAVNKKIVLTGNGTAAPSPNITVEPPTLSFGNLVINTFSEKSFNLNGVNLTGNVLVEAPAGYTVSQTSGSGFATSTTISQSGGTIANKKIFVKFAPTEVKDYNLNIACSSNGAVSQNVGLTGAGTQVPIPAILLDQTSLNFGFVTIYSMSNAQSVQVTGSNIATGNNITIEVPNGYEVSTTSKFRKAKSRSVTLPNTGGTIFVRFNPTLIQDYNGNLTLKANGANDKIIMVTGKGKDPDFVWAKSGGGQSYDRSYNIAVDAQGNCYSIGVFNDLGTFGTSSLTSSGYYDDLYITKNDINGNFIWVKKIGGPSGNEVSAGIEVDSQGDIIIAGIFSGTATFDDTEVISNGLTDIFVAKLDHSDGHIIWKKQIGSATNEVVSSMMIDQQNNIYLSGYFNGTTLFGATSLTSSGSDGFVSKLSSDGSFVWTTQILVSGTNGLVNYNVIGQSIGVDQTGNIYVGGEFKGTAKFGSSTLVTNPSNNVSSTDIFVTKLNSSGQFLWARQAGGTSEDFCKSITVDDQGNSYITGNFQGSTKFGTSIILTASGYSDIFISKLDSDGNFIWAKKTGGSSADYGNSIIIDYRGYLYITGNYTGSANFDSFQLTANGQQVFIARMDSNGNYLWVNKCNGEGDDYGNDITCNKKEDIYVTGTFEGSITFGNVPKLNSIGGKDIFITKIK